MSLDEATRERIEGLIRETPVLLFMKGNRESPQCGFSATVVRILDTLIPEYATADVLQDAELRDGIKVFSSWPTIPQLYVGGEFVGGCDIVQELFANGELQQTLGVQADPDVSPEINVTEAATQALKQIVSERAPEGHAVHLQIDARFQSHLGLSPPEAGEIEIKGPGISLFLDPMSASRAHGIRIDVVETSDGTGFHIENPNAPEVHALPPEELRGWLESGRSFELLDVRTPEERALSSIDTSVLLTAEEAARVEALPRETSLVFYCKAGGRSQQAAEYFAQKGFTEVHNLVGGIDAWLETNGS